MAYAEPPTKSTGDLISAANWNQDVKDNVRWLAQDHWRAAMTRSTDQTGIVTSTFTTIDWTATTYDFGAMASLTNNNFTVPSTFPSGITTALFGMGCFVIWDGNTTGSRNISIQKNSVRMVEEFNDTGTQSEQSIYTELEGVASDVFRFQVFQDSGANRSLLGATITLKCFIRWLAWQD